MLKGWENEIELSVPRKHIHLFYESQVLFIPSQKASTCKLVVVVKFRVIRRYSTVKCKLVLSANVLTVCCVTTLFILLTC